MVKVPTRVRRDLRGTKIAGKTVTPAQWQSGALLRALQAPGQRVAPKPAAPAPTAPAAAAPQAAPLDAAYLGQMEGLARTRDQTLGDVTGGRQAGLLGYGYNESPTGALSFDPSNPFSKAALLKQNYDRSRRSSAQTMGAGGQLYAGAFQNQQDLVNRGQLQGEDALQKSLQDFLARNTSARDKAQTDYQFGGAQAESDRLGRIDTNPLYEPTATAPDVQTAATNPKAYPEITRPSAAHGGAKWVYRKSSTGKLIPLRPA